MRLEYYRQHDAIGIEGPNPKIGEGTERKDSGFTRLMNVSDESWVSVGRYGCFGGKYKRYI